MICSVCSFSCRSLLSFYDKFRREVSFIFYSSLLHHCFFRIGQCLASVLWFFSLFDCFYRFGCTTSIQHDPIFPALFFVLGKHRFGLATKFRSVGKTVVQLITTKSKDSETDQRTRLCHQIMSNISSQV